MNNMSSRSPINMTPPPSLSDLVRPRRISGLSDSLCSRKAEFTTRVAGLWSLIETLSVGSEPSQAVFRRLVEITWIVKATLDKQKAAYTKSDPGVSAARKPVSPKEQTFVAPPINTSTGKFSGSAGKTHIEASITNPLTGSSSDADTAQSYQRARVLDMRTNIDDMVTRQLLDDGDLSTTATGPSNPFHPWRPVNRVLPSPIPGSLETMVLEAGITFLTGSDSDNREFLGEFNSVLKDRDPENGPADPDSVFDYRDYLPGGRYCLSFFQGLTSSDNSDVPEVSIPSVSNAILEAGPIFPSGADSSTSASSATFQTARSNWARKPRIITNLGEDFETPTTFVNLDDIDELRRSLFRAQKLEGEEGFAVYPVRPPICGHVFCYDDAKMFILFAECLECGIRFEDKAEAIAGIGMQITHCRRHLTSHSSARSSSIRSRATSSVDINEGATILHPSSDKLLVSRRQHTVHSCDETAESGSSDSDVLLISRRKHIANIYQNATNSDSSDSEEPLVSRRKPIGSMRDDTSSWEGFSDQEDDVGFRRESSLSPDGDITMKDENSELEEDSAHGIHRFVVCKEDTIMTDGFSEAEDSALWENKNITLDDYVAAVSLLNLRAGINDAQLDKC